MKGLEGAAQKVVQGIDHGPYHGPIIRIQYLGHVAKAQTTLELMLVFCPVPFVGQLVCGRADDVFREAFFGLIPDCFVVSQVQVLEAVMFARIAFERGRFGRTSKRSEPNERCRAIEKFQLLRCPVDVHGRSPRFDQANLARGEERRC